MALRKRGYLTEATFNFDRDVEFIYQKSGLQKVFDAIQTGVPSRMKRAIEPFLKSPTGKITWIGDSDELRSRVARRADKLNPVEIVVGIFSEGSSYKPYESEIRVSSNFQALTVFKQVDYDPRAINQMLGTQVKRFRKEFTGATFKTSAYHELAHWADDTLHNKHIQNRMARANELGGRSFLRGKHARMGHTPIEMNAQVHAVKALKKEIGKRAFDRLDWAGLFRHKSSLMANFSGFRDSRDYYGFMKRFMKRLDREGLLGKGLKRYPNYNQMQGLHTFV